MKNFKIKRFGNVMAWQLTGSVRHIMFFFGTAMCFIVGFMSVSVLIKHNIMDTSDIRMLATLYGLAFMIYMVTCSACIIGNMKSRSARMATLLLPASKLEKFIARYIFLLILYPLAAIIGMIAGDLIQMGITELTVGDSMSISNCMLSYLEGTFGYFRDDKNPAWINYLAFFIGCLTIHSIYLYVGTFFRKYPWVTANVTIIVIGLCVAGLFTTAGYEILNLIYGKGGWYIGYIESQSMITIDNIFTVAFTCLFYWLAYRRYKRVEV